MKADNFKDFGEKQISQLLGQLEKVTAPANFDFLLKARITQVKSSKSNRFAFSWFAYTTIGFLIVLVTTIFFYHLVSTVRRDEFLGLNSFSKTGELTSTVPERYENAPESISDSQSLNESMGEKKSSDVRNVNKTSKATKLSNSIYTSVNRRKYEIKEHSISPSAVENLKGFSSLKTPVNDAVNDSRLRKLDSLIMQTLRQIGIEGEFETNGFRVHSIRSNSMAEKLGLKIHDIVLAINGKPLKALTSQDMKLEIRQILVKRASQELQIGFQK
ncbi:MAG: hypothetical protein D6735_04630 [Acidobacteria bacterium]|nr:MAG: hypothetical protein D6735_04630 [Acidobacteriota bacterium]